MWLDAEFYHGFGMISISIQYEMHHFSQKLHFHLNEEQDSFYNLDVISKPEDTEPNHYFYLPHFLGLHCMSNSLLVLCYIHSCLFCCPVLRVEEFLHVERL